ncbi:MAG TPA: ATP-binding protein [Verrucomicrobiae bacterium]|nr:ATP-binding protein [Verrucomicrobiae bacterium]
MEVAKPKNEPAPSQTAIVRKENWLADWLQPNRSKAIILGVVIFLFIVAVSGLVFETGGTGFAWLHLMYLPIILAAAVFRLRGGITAALVAGLALGPHMPLDVAKGLHQTPSNWIFRTVFFLLVGVFSGLMSNFLNWQIQRLKETNQRLFQAHEELKSAQMKLIQTAKLESIGRLAAGVAHEVKNPLAVIQLGVDYLKNTRTENTNEDTVETVQLMGDAVQRADTVIKGLLNFSRSEPLVLVPLDLNVVIEDSLLLVKHELTKNHITLEKQLAAKLPKVELDQNKVKQVFINMFMNAIQAMGDNGTLSVKTSLQSGGVTEQNPSGKIVVLEIEDTGAGIPEDKLDKLFEPFFTTKPVGSGTGLGLSVSRNIIEMHRGSITIGNRKQVRGAIVTITFPVPNPKSL